ncbi:MAG: hypothetical protein ACREGF_03375, partial [Candidatus Saccharimonadales bacterium]
MMKKFNLLRAKRLQASLALLILTAVIVGGVVVLPDKNNQSSQMPVALKINPNAPNNSMYKNGTYSAIGSYNSPGGEESIKVTLKFINGQVAQASFVSGSNSATSASYQQLFINKYKTGLIGQPIKNIKVSSVSG